MSGAKLLHVPQHTVYPSFEAVMYERERMWLLERFSQTTPKNLSLVKLTVRASPEGSDTLSAI